MVAPAYSPTNLMLQIPSKKPNATPDFYHPIRNYIFLYYGELEAQNLEHDLQTLNQLRTQLERGLLHSLLPTRIDLLQNYYKTLSSLEARFPDSRDKYHNFNVSFSWFDAFKVKRKATHQNIQFEKAAVLFNLGAVHSQMGLCYDHSSIEGRRRACHSFIAAEGEFAFLRDNVATIASMGSSTTVDVSVECTVMLERLMLAQAQECVFENTIAKGSTPGVCAKISKQVSIYYEKAFAALNVAPLKQHFKKGWLAHVQLKAVLFYAESCYQYGLELHEKEEIGEEISRLKSGVSALSKGKRTCQKGHPNRSWM